MIDFQPIVHVSSPDLVKRKIRQASSEMFVREFLQNAMEAASLAAFPRVKWMEFAFPEEGWRKLAIWNNGKGMDADELLSVMNLGASGDEKRQGAADNFGMGAKLTGLRANHDGILWRSCKAGSVYQLHLGWNNDEPGIIAQANEYERPALVMDISHEYEGLMLSKFDATLLAGIGGRDCRITDFDWTQVIFLGNDFAKQDTVVDPLGNGSPVGGRSYWLSRQINRRYYDIEKWNVTAFCDRGETVAQNRRCKGLYHIVVEREETVRIENGLIRYCLLPELHESNEGAKGYRGHVALVFRNEIYDGLFDGTWGIHSPKYGVIAGAPRIAIQVVLSDDFCATPNEQRTAVEREMPFGERRVVTLMEFEDAIEANMPQFLMEFIASEDSKRSRGSSKLNAKLKRLMQNLGLRAPSVGDSGEADVGSDDDEGVAPTRKERAGGGCGGGGGRRKPSLPRLDFFGSRGKPVKTAPEKNMRSLPNIVWEPMKDEESPTEVGHYVDKSHTIYMREDHEVLKQLVDKVIASGVSPSYREQVWNEAKDQIGYAAARHVLFAHSMLQGHRWCETKLKAALTPESITASIGFYEMHYQSVENAFRLKKKQKSA